MPGIKPRGSEMGGTPPTEEEALIIDPSVICEEHTEALSEWDIPIIPNGIMETIQACTTTREFYEEAYKAKNGYEMPEDMEMGDVPESEAPGNPHINEAIRELEPLCCFFAEVSDFETEKDIDPYIFALASWKGQQEESDE